MDKAPALVCVCILVLTLVNSMVLDKLTSLSSGSVICTVMMRTGNGSKWQHRPRQGAACHIRAAITISDNHHHNRTVIFPHRLSQMCGWGKKNDSLPLFAYLIAYLSSQNKQKPNMLAKQNMRGKARNEKCNLISMFL